MKDLLTLMLTVTVIVIILLAFVLPLMLYTRLEEWIIQPGTYKGSPPC